MNLVTFYKLPTDYTVPLACCVCRLALGPHPHPAHALPLAQGTLPGAEEETAQAVRGGAGPSQAGRCWKDKKKRPTQHIPLLKSVVNRMTF